MFQLEPSGAEPQVEPATAHLIERRGHLRREARVAVGVAVDQRADTRTLGVLAERTQKRPAFHARAGRVGHEDRIEMIECPERVVAPAVGLAPEGAQLLPFDVLLSGLNSKADRMLVHWFSSVMALDSLVIVAPAANDCSILQELCV